MIPNSSPQRTRALRCSSAKWSSSAPLDPAGTSRRDSFSPAPGDSEVITHFDTTINRQVVARKKNKKAAKKCKKIKNKKKKPKCLKKAKKKKIKLFYASAKCTKGAWNYRGDFVFESNTGGPDFTMTDFDSQGCVKVKKKKKKKK